VISSYLPKQPYVVLDQNLFRKQDVIRDLLRRCCRDRMGVLVTDTAVYEFSKGPKAYGTWRHSLENLCAEPDLCFSGRSLGQMMREEIKTGQPMQNVVDESVTPWFRLLLEGLRRGNDERMNRALAEVARSIDREKQLREQHGANKTIVVALQDHLQNTLPAAELKHLHRRDEETIVRILAEMETAALIFQAAKSDGCSDETALALTRGPSVYGHLVYSLAGLALDWLAQSGLCTADPARITNDFHDLDYICTATFCSDLATEDKRAARIYSALTKALEQRFQRILSIEANANQGGDPT